jgi:hypothetical protein
MFLRVQRPHESTKRVRKSNLTMFVEKHVIFGCLLGWHVKKLLRTRLEVHTTHCFTALTQVDYYKSHRYEGNAE